MVEKRNQKLFATLLVFSALIIMLYAIYFIQQNMTITNKSSEASFPANYAVILKFNLSIEDGEDEFSAAMTRLKEKNGHGKMKTYSASNSYSKFEVNDSLLCWEDSKFRETFEENCHFIQTYPTGDSGPYLKEIGLSRDFVDFPNFRIPVLVTAASSNHFLEVQALMRNLHSVVFPKYKNLKFIFYDIGLKENEKEMVKKHCRCEYRSFPFEKYPEHVKILKGYTFKPLITQTVLNEYGFVMWMDASVRFRTGELDSLFEMATKDGVKIIPGDLGVGYRTDPVTFKFLREDPCLFADKKEIQATFFMLYRTRFTIETIMRPWVSCALTSGCMYFPGSQSRISCANQNGLGFCHRFDQSVLSIILWRLYHADFGRVYIPETFFHIQRNHIARYFEYLEKKNNL
ncbi:hypothetical protein CHS0354_020248 [Potamilus streckersoni]|uniref:Uncharacterized protein n=1 Tax=Potamilus streckersoni TaxID=2493646 RepID=A0AAE0S5A8_9BIVA|nr:hypothetical protein CHS0354_020248 [Potamilus streckersoni]